MNFQPQAATSFNFPILSIPLYYAIAVYPHGHAIVRANKGDLNKHDNRNPKSASLQEGLKKRLTAREYAAWERAESCHRNHLENMPLYVAAVIVGLLAEQRAGAGSVGLNSFCVGWLAVRTLYTVNYITAETLQWSYLRSLLYFVGTFWSVSVFGRSAMVFGS